jgi:tRNA(adenine34) deaminase
MKKKWLHKIATDSTSPPERVFTKDAETIAKIMAKPEVSPKGIGSAIRMVQYFINRGGKGLSRERKKELEKAKRLLQERMKRK